MHFISASSLNDMITWPIDKNTLTLHHCHIFHISHQIGIILMEYNSLSRCFDGEKVDTRDSNNIHIHQQNTYVHCVWYECVDDIYTFFYSSTHNNKSVLKNEHKIYS